MKTHLARRLISLALALCLCIGLAPSVSMQVEAAGYYSESDLGNIKCTILSNSARASYVNTMMRYHILSSTDNYRVARNLENGSSVVFFFDGCSDNVDDPTYGNYNNYHLSAYCAVVQKVNGVLKVVYESENCSTIPDNPRNVSLNDGTAVPTVLDGVYNIISTNHLSRYASLRISDNSGSVPVIRCTSSTSYISTSNAINIHARSNFSGAPTNGICSSSYSSTGCFNVGLTNNTWSEYNNFIANAVGVSNAIKTTPYSSGSWTKCTSGVDKGVVVVDRSHYKTQLAAIYGGDNSNSASNLVAKITAYTDNLDYSGHTTHTYTGSYYEAAHPHKVYQMCSCGATQYTGGTTTVSTCESCNPVTSSSKYNSVLPFKAYLKGTSIVYPYTTAQLATQSGGEIWSTDECTITAVYSNGACKVSYPVGSSTKTAYTSLSNFIGNTSASLTKLTVNHQITTYIRSSTSSTVYGYISAGDTIYKMGTSGSMTQIFYPVSSGYKLAWVLTSELTEPTYDNRFNPYCPIKGYPCATATFNAYDSDYTTDIGDIWTTDYCTINAVYADGWCQVTYPVGSGTKTGYTKLSNFVYNVSASHTKYTAKAQTTTYTNQSLVTNNGWLSAGDVFYVVGAYGSASQVLYPLDAQYGGGYKLGWISTSSLPKTTYTISYNANGGSGAPSNQTKTHGTALKLSTTVPTRSGYAFVGWATSSSATSATYASGASYTTDANITLYAVWTLNKYEITYNANGGTDAPATQNKAHGTDMTLSTSEPTKSYIVTFDPNGGTVDVAKRQGSCEFMGWATSSTATTAAYQPGGTFTTNANTTLYAVWKNPTMTKYSTPVREGYVFDGWYTAAEGGTQITTTTTISSDMTVYAHWTVATYGVIYDANGGDNAPAEQIKTYGENLTISNTVPTRENYTFMGWATEENPTQVEYQPGDTYSANSGIVLIAVWSCDLNPTITLESVSGKPGDSVTVAVRITENPGIIAARLKISYDSSALQLTNVVDAGILGEYNFGDNLSSNPYIVTWSNGTAQADYTANGDLVYLTFKIADDAQVGSLPITISYDEEEIFNKALENINFAITAGNVTVEEDEEIDPDAPQIIVNSVKGREGATVSVAISLKNNPGIASMRLKVDYDSSALTLVGVNDLGELGSQLHSDQYTDPYVLCWANDTVTQNFTHNGDIVVLTFKINDDAAIGTYDISISYDYDKYDIHNVQVQKVKFYTVDGAVEVVDVLPGDANGDGSVDTLDRLTLSRYLANWKGYTLDQLNFAGADVNSDGSVDTLDRLILSRHLANWSGYEDITNPPT